MPQRRFPPPWTAEETDAGFIVRDANGHALAYVYCDDEPGRRATTRRNGRIYPPHDKCRVRGTLRRHNAAAVAQG
jgi:hypothetical protein